MSPSGTPSSVKPSWFWLKPRSEIRVDHSYAPKASDDWKLTPGSFATALSGEVPGVSRSGATILGGVALGVERRTAAEFSFFLAIPTMLGASALEIWKDRHVLASGGGVSALSIAIGCLVAFVVALVVVRWFVTLVGRRGFGPFAWYRIAAGSAALVWLMRG